jgi:hypothetical protein
MRSVSSGLSTGCCASRRNLAAVECAGFAGFMCGSGPNLSAARPYSTTRWGGRRMAKKKTTNTPTINPTTNNLPRLELPKRWELLRARADAAGVDPVEFVERVDSAAERIDKLLNRVRTAGGGLFEIILGLSGSGKTTFLNTLPKFFERVRVETYPREEPLTGLPTFIEQRYVPGETTDRIVVIERRDNPQPTDLAQVEPMMVELLETFREQFGSVLVLWPITNPEAAETIAQVAWKVGRDSIADAETRGRYEFKGIPRERYYSLADATSKSLTGDGLEAFGVDQTVGNSLLADSETISDYFGAIVRRTDEVRTETWSVLKARFRARLWVLLPGDDGTALRSTVAALTQGTRNRVDIDRIGEFIDRIGTTPLYVSEWKKRRAGLAHLLRAIDVRLFEVPPNIALAAIRSFGEDAIKRPLKQRSANLKQSKSPSIFNAAMKASCGMSTLPNWRIFFLARLLLVEQLAFAGGVAAVAFRGHVLAQR